MKLRLEYDRTPLMTSQQWFRWLLGAVRHQAITWASVDSDLYHHMILLRDDEFKKPDWNKKKTFSTVDYINEKLRASVHIIGFPTYLPLTLLMEYIPVC